MNFGPFDVHLAGYFMLGIIYYGVTSYLLWRIATTLRRFIAGTRQPIPFRWFVVQNGLFLAIQLVQLVHGYPSL